MKKNKQHLSSGDSYKILISEISDVLAQSRKLAFQTVNTVLTTTYWRIGRQIVEFEQDGKERAEYGSQLLQKLSDDLTEQFGEGFSYRNIRLIRQFYTIFPNWHTVSAKSKKLSWSHYVRLIRIENADERSFYEIESEKNNWSVRELCRQLDTSLYERLALSRDKKGIKDLAKKGQIIEKSEDIFKEPYVLDFLGLDESHLYSEKDLESAIIDNLEHFLLELGRGFTFVARQKRITSGVKHFYIDLVFYNRSLKCFVLIDLKIGELKHQDIGQMQMYVNYFDRDVKEKDENQTIGIVLCKEKDHFVVEYTLPQGGNQIFAKQYRLYLPKKEELIKQVEKITDLKKLG